MHRCVAIEGGYLPTVTGTTGALVLAVVSVPEVPGSIPGPVTNDF